MLASWRNNFSQLLHVHGARHVRQTEIHMAEPLVPKPSASEIDLAIENINTHKSPGSDQIPAEVTKAGVEQFTLRSTNLLILFGIRRNC